MNRLIVVFSHEQYSLRDEVVAAITLVPFNQHCDCVKMVKIARMGAIN
jgi:alpha-L-arabinofuranosidase